MATSYSNVLDESDINYIISLSEVEVARDKVMSRSENVVYFTVELTSDIKDKLLSQMGLDLSNVSKIPMRWIRGDTRPHIDSGDVFENTYLVYLTDSEGSLVIGDETLPISKNTGYVFNEGLHHETIGTGNEPRLLLGPMSEHGIPVGIYTISVPGNTTIHLRDTEGTIEYSLDEDIWTEIFRPCLIENTSTSDGYVKVVLNNDMTFTDAFWYFVMGSGYIQFGDENLNEDGSIPIIYISGVSDYPGLIQNGYDGGNGYERIRVYNIDVRAINETTLATGAGWLGQAYFCNSVGYNYIINCTSDGDVNVNGGGIVGEHTAPNGGNLEITGCYAYGDITDQAGGLVGYNAAIDSGYIQIKSCYATGIIDGDEAGGLVGKNAANNNATVDIIDCYTTGNITGAESGGLVGSYAGSSGGVVNVSYSYTRGGIMGSGAGGIVGSNAVTFNISNCYVSGDVTDGTITSGVVGSNHGDVVINHTYTCGAMGSGDNYFFIGDDTVPETCYSEAEHSTSGWNTTNANTVLDDVPTDAIGLRWMATVINEPYELTRMGYTPYTRAIIVNESLYREYAVMTFGNTPEKDMDNADYTAEFDPQDYQETFFPDMADFIDENIVLGDKEEGTKNEASYWDDLGNDVFDDWGYFYLYDVTDGKYYFPLLTPQNEADGVITTQTFTAFERSFTIKHGWATRGIFKFEITVADELPFIFGGYGNMGSDGDEEIEDRTYSYTIGGNSRTLYYHYHAESGDSNERLLSYFIPHNNDENNEQTYHAYYDSDDMSIMSKVVTTGLTVYFAKSNDVKVWVVEQLKVAANEAEYTVNPGDSTSAALIEERNYLLLGMTGGDEDSYETITVDTATGVITTTSSTAAGEYVLYIRNTGSYHISTYTLIISESENVETAESPSNIRPCGTNGYDLALYQFTVFSKLFVPITAPSTATSTGNKGDVRFGNGYIYVCVAPNTWKRAAIATW